MNKALPTAIIVGIEHFVAKKLAKILLSKDINVIGVGEYAVGFEEEKNYDYRIGLDEVSEKVSYVFDFGGKEETWNLALRNGAKLTVISVNKKNISRVEIEKLKAREEGWRLVEAFGVYGPEMEEDGFLAAAIRQAVRNENLELPQVGEVFRLLSREDCVEAILRASFLSGTEGEIFKVGGVETNSAEVAEVLIDEAKMTKVKVLVSEIKPEEEDEREVAETRRRLRWEPEMKFKEGVKETLQYFFSKLDDENRRGGKRQRVEIVREEVLESVEKAEKENERKLVEVVVEEMTEGENEVEEKVEIAEKKAKIQDEEKDGEKKVESLVEKADDSKIMRVKNSNIRPVASDEVIEEEETIEGVEEKVYHKEEKPSEKEEGNNLEEIPIIKKRKRKVLYKIWLLLALMMVLSIPVYGVGLGMVTYKNIEKSIEMMEKRDMSGAEELIEADYKRVDRVDKKIDEMGLNRIGIVRNYQRLLKVVKEGLSTGLEGVELLTISNNIGEGVFEGKNLDWEKELKRLVASIDEVGARSGVLQARLGGDWSWVPARWRVLPQKAGRQIDGLRKDLELSKGLIGIAPEILGLDGTRRDYLVLLQNETEIRPGGGFIGSFAILSFEKGKLLGFEVKDVYEADGQLKGHVEPPEEIKNHLGIAGWFMRDANWNPNFMVSSAQVQWFLEKEIGKKVDGVIGIDLAVVKEILAVVGEINVVDFNEKVNKDNLYEQAEFYAETKSFPGSIQKASFLGGVSKQLFEEIKLMDAKKKLLLTKGLIKQLESNDLQIALNNKEAAGIVAEMGWDGTLYEGRCKIEDCVSDYIYLVEANLGVNKANYFLYRNAEQVVDISSRSISRIVRVNYENTAKNDNWPGGDYKNYLRIYLPDNINIAEVSITDENGESGKRVYTREELKINRVGSKTELGFLVLVPVNSKRVVEIRYSSEVDLMGKEKFSYIHYTQRQPGFGDTGLVTLVSMPEGWQPIQVQPAASLVGGKLLFNMKLDKDIRMGIELSK